MTWQDILLIVVSIAVAALVFLTVYFSARAIIAKQKSIAEEQRKQTQFLEALRKAIGSNGGTDIATRLHDQDLRAEEARLLAERIAKESQAEDEESRKERTELRKMILNLQLLVEKMQTENAWQQRFNELQAKALAAGITLSVVNAAQESRMTQAIQSGGIAVEGGETSVSGDMAGGNANKATE